MVSVEAAVAALDSKVWALAVAEQRPRAVAGTVSTPRSARAAGPESSTPGHVPE
jgi:hypothetical protein